MTAPTSYERREVAERLRRCAQNVSDTLDFAMYLSYWVGIDRGSVMDDEGNHFSAIANRRLAEKTLERLADLIDPTCEIEYVAPIEHVESDKTKINVGYYFKLTCGHGVIRPYEEMPPAFCDECGARVVGK